MTKCILVIDDEPGILEVVRVAFKVLTSWETLPAADCPSGITLALDRRPDAILLDVMLPGMDGITAFHGLQEHPLTRSIPVILLTAKARAIERARFQELPIAGIITKPFKAQDLVQQIRSILAWND
jgi:CheY-like chemotaxis protein